MARLDPFTTGDLDENRIIHECLWGWEAALWIGIGAMSKAAETPLGSRLWNFLASTKLEWPSLAAVAAVHPSRVSLAGAPVRASWRHTGVG
jgi:hypothetical protein